MDKAVYNFDMVSTRFDKPADQNYTRRAAILMAGLLLTVPGLARSPLPEQAYRAPIETLLKPGEVFEECVLMRAGQRLRYLFHTSEVVEFNIHYHDKQQNRIIYLVEPALIDTNPVRRQHSVPESRIICLMWDNKRNQPISLTYSYTLNGI